MSIPLARGDEFDTGLLGNHCWLELACGERIELDVDRWSREPENGDELMLSRCVGPTLDIGCGPGRLVAALDARGVPTLGIDTSDVAVDLTRGRGATAVRRSVFDRLPEEGNWRHVLLADGNIGIGGDPVALLRRSAELLTADGTVLVEVDPPGHGVRAERVRVGGARTEGGWFTWAWLGVDMVDEVAAAAGLRTVWSAGSDRRWFAELARSCP